MFKEKYEFVSEYKEFLFERIELDVFEGYLSEHDGEILKENYVLISEKMFEFFNEFGWDVETGDELVRLDLISNEILCNVKKDRMIRKKYYWLPLDNYRQPNGNIVELEMNYYELNVMKDRGEYVFDSYYQAMLRAND